MRVCVCIVYVCLCSCDYFVLDAARWSGGVQANVCRIGHGRMCRHMTVSVCSLFVCLCVCVCVCVCVCARVRAGSMTGNTRHEYIR